MKLIDKYIFGQFMVPFIYALFTFSLLFVIADLFDHLSDFIDARTPLLEVFRYYLFVMPSLLVYIVPISLLLGLLYSLWQLSRHSELTALRASGISFYRITVPILLVGIVASIFISILQVNHLFPKACNVLLLTYHRKQIPRSHKCISTRDHYLSGFV